MSIKRRVILVVSDDYSFCSEMRAVLERNHPAARVATVSNLDAARQVVEDAPPTVVILDESGLWMSAEVSQWRNSLEASVAWLGSYAPIIIAGKQDPPLELAAFMAAGVADYVQKNGEEAQKIARIVDRRLRQDRELLLGFDLANKITVNHEGESSEEDFGQVLRHELNNPLTGILGNAELLLADIRRRGDGQMPDGAQERLETIAALAVRLRETVRKLSQEWEVRYEVMRVS